MDKLSTFTPLVGINLLSSPVIVDTNKSRVGTDHELEQIINWTCFIESLSLIAFALTKVM